MREPIDSKRLPGLKIFTVGLLVAIAGFALAVSGLQTFGWAVGWIGALIAIGGMALHILLLITHAFGSKDRDGG